MFSLKVNECIFEVLITEKTTFEKPSKGKGKGKAQKGRGPPPPTASVTLSSSSTAIQEERIDRLEAKAGSLEKKHEALDHKIDTHYNGLSNQLRQVSHHLQPRQHEPSHQRNSDKLDGAPGPNSAGLVVFWTVVLWLPACFEGGFFGVCIAAPLQRTPRVLWATGDLAI